MYWEDLLRVGAALLAGGLIGLERELHDKPAGFRTNILISVGAALFTVLSQRIGEALHVDGTRMIAQIVTGVGFLGAGAIIQSRGRVTGLTTAATIWAVAAVGTAFGAGQFFLGVVGTALIHGVLIGLNYVDGLIDRRRTMASFEIRLERSLEACATIRRRIEELGLITRDWSITKDHENMIVTVLLSGPSTELARLQSELAADGRVTAFTRL